MFLIFAVDFENPAILQAFLSNQQLTENNDGSLNRLFSW
jgi:hypothetical protein